LNSLRSVTLKVGLSSLIFVGLRRRASADLAGRACSLKVVFEFAFDGSTLLDGPARNRAERLDDQSTSAAGRRLIADG
jgi:hypothetical protein